MCRLIYHAIVGKLNQIKAGEVGDYQKHDKEGDTDLSGRHREEAKGQINGLQYADLKA